MDDNQEKIKIIIWGIIEDLFDAHEVLKILHCIGENARELNEATFGQFFGSLQRHLGRSLSISVSKLFEEEKGYPLCSIPACIKYIDEHSETIRVSDKNYLVEALGEDLDTSLKLNGYSDSEISKYVVAKFRGIISSHTIQTELQESILKLKHVRDKKLAHHENIPAEPVQSITFAAIEDLIRVADYFLKVVSRPYASIVSYGSKDSFIGSDAARSTVCLKRLISVIPKKGLMK